MPGLVESQQPGEFELSVVIPALNVEDVLPRQLDSLRSQTVPFSWEVVIADNGSSDGTRQVAEAYADEMNIRVVDASRRKGINVARNEAIKSAVGRYILMCDADDVVESDWILHHWRALTNENVMTGGALRRVLGEEVEEPTSDLPHWLNFLPWATGANCGFSRDLWERLGHFDESYKGGGDETAFFWHGQLIGEKLVFVPNAAVRYEQRSTSESVRSQNVGFGRSHVKLYSEFHSFGMKRRTSKAKLKEILHVLRLLRAPSNNLSDRRKAKALGLFWGHVSGWLRYRAFY